MSPERSCKIVSCGIFLNVHVQGTHMFFEECVQIFYFLVDGWPISFLNWNFRNNANFVRSTKKIGSPSDGRKIVSPLQKFHLFRRELPHWPPRLLGPPGPARKQLTWTHLRKPSTTQPDEFLQKKSLDLVDDFPWNWYSVMARVMMFSLWALLSFVCTYVFCILSFVFCLLYFVFYLHFCLVLKQAADIGEDGKGNDGGKSDQWGAPRYWHLRPGTAIAWENGQNC